MHRRLGFLFLTKMVVLGIRKRSKNRLNYLLKKHQYPQHLVYVAGLGNSGSGWMANLHSSLPGFAQFSPVKWNQTYLQGEINEHALYAGAFEELSGKLVVVKSHSYGTLENATLLKATGLKYIITVRDPRDTIISQYWHIRRTPYHIDYSLATQYSLQDYIAQKLFSGSFEKTILTWIRGWLQNRDPHRSIIIRYEDMLNNTHFHWKRILSFLKFEVDDRTVQEIVDLHSFERKTGRKPGHEDTSQVQRTGISGEWKSVFSRSLKHRFSQCGEDVIEALGYEPTLLGL